MEDDEFIWGIINDDARSELIKLARYYGVKTDVMLGIILLYMNEFHSKEKPTIKRDINIRNFTSEEIFFRIYLSQDTYIDILESEAIKDFLTFLNEKFVFPHEYVSRKLKFFKEGMISLVYPNESSRFIAMKQFNKLNYKFLGINLHLLFNLAEYNSTEIAEMINTLSDLYYEISGDELEIKSANQYSFTTSVETVRT